MNKSNQFINPETEQRIDELLALMTLEEKIGQLHQVAPSPVGAFDISEQDKMSMLDSGMVTQKELESNLIDRNDEDIAAGKIGFILGVYDIEKSNRLQRIAVERSRLHIPLLIGGDVLHGLNTVFPTPLAESCSFDDELFEQTAAAAAREARSIGIHMNFSPMIDISRDARWGRIVESPGQDPHLASRFARCKVRGIQGENAAALRSPEHMLACAKHFAAYGAATGGRDYNTVEISEQQLFECYLPPFAAAIDEGAAGIMPAFHDINGVPCTANAHLLHDILRDKLGFEGVTVSDASAVMQLINHGYSKDLYRSAVDSLCAGTDVDMTSYAYIKQLAKAIENGDITLEQIDVAVRRVLRLKFALGLFEQPYADKKHAEQTLCSEKMLQLSHKAALESMVLLKNNGVLPLSGKLRIAAVGFDDLPEGKWECFGSWAWCGSEKHAVTPLEALRQRCESVKYARVCSINDDFNKELFLSTIKDADVVIAFIGERTDMAGEAKSYADISLCGAQKQLVQALSELSVPVVSVLQNGRPLAVPDAVDASDAVLEAWQCGSLAGTAIADILFGSYNPSGRLTVNIPNKTGECPSYYNHPSTGRPATDFKPWTSKYEDTPLAPLFSFGYGLSYTEYEYSDRCAKICGNSVEVSVTVKNTGKMSGVETVQLYVHDLFASRVRPVRELKGYRRVTLLPQQSSRVTIAVPIKELGLYNANMEYVVEPGEFEFFIGHDSNADSAGIVEIG